MMTYHVKKKFREKIKIGNPPPPFLLTVYPIRVTSDNCHLRGDSEEVTATENFLGLFAVRDQTEKGCQILSSL